MPKITKIEPLENYVLRITYTTGEIGTLDMADEITKAPPGSGFADLKDKTFFSKVFIDDDGWCAAWRPKFKLALSPDVTYVQATKKYLAPIPNIEEVKRLALEVHSQEIGREGLDLGWPWSYEQADRYPVPQESAATFMPAFFWIGLMCIWAVGIEWEDGDDQPPDVHVYDNRKEWEDEHQSIELELW